jgi:hypothetical protein
MPLGLPPTLPPIVARHIADGKNTGNEKGDSQNARGDCILSRPGAASITRRPTTACHCSAKPLRHFVPRKEVVVRVGLEVSSQVLDLNRPSPVLGLFPSRHRRDHLRGLMMVLYLRRTHPPPPPPPPMRFRARGLFSYTVVTEGGEAKALWGCCL